MPLFVVPLNQVRSNLEPPPQVREYVNSGVWQQINAARTEVAASSNCSALAIECCICWLCIPLIPFLFHPCCTLAFSKPLMDQKLHAISMSHYGHPGVIRMDFKNLYVDTDLLPRGGPQTTASPAYVTVTPQQHYPEVAYAVPATNNNSYATPATKPYPSDNMYGPQVVATPVSTKRKMRVRIPPNTPPGSIINVMSPEGLQVQVAVPPGASPGSEIEVEY